VDVVATQSANVANVARRRGDLARARALARQAIELNAALGHRKWVAVSLEHLAKIAAAEGLGEGAARLLGVAESLRTAMGAPHPQSERDDIHGAVAVARAALGEARWQAAYTAGHHLTLEEAIAEALGTEGTDPVQRQP
jgi:non-specific serine/threonine protein kinase